MRAVCRFILGLTLFAGILPWVSAASYKLGIAPAANKVVVSWPVAASNYVLQSTISLAVPSWQTVTAPAAVIVNNTNTVTYTNNSLTRFFRLILSTNVSGVRLNIVSGANNTFLITWPVSASNYVLQTSASLSSPSWTTVTNPPTIAINNTNTVTYTNDFRSRFFRLSMNTNTVNPYAGMVLIPAGAFMMGDVNDTNITGDAAPVSVTLSAYYMDANLVNYSLWQSVYNYASAAGYQFDYSGSAKDSYPNHPVQTVNWYDTVKWCNARSQQIGLTPAYYTDPALTQIYTNGDLDAVYVNWSANGFRLPTEAEWEKAARGGQSGRRFPWGNLISTTNANYYGLYNADSYDVGPSGDNSAFVTPGDYPYTSPCGYFAPNGYGLYDMGGNVAEWCWNWYATPYSGGTDPHGPTNPTTIRVLRGGDWNDDAGLVRCASRNNNFIIFSPPFLNNASGNPYIGFRCVRAH